MMASQNFAFRKGPSPKRLGQGWVYDRVQARRNDGGCNVSSASTRRKPTNNVPATSVVPITERQAAESFAAVVLRIDAGTLASAAKRTKEAAKMWKAGRRCPNGSSLINMSSDIDVVWAWLQGEVEKRRATTANDTMAKLQQKAQMGDPEARAILAMINSKLS